MTPWRRRRHCIGFAFLIRALASPVGLIRFLGRLVAVGFFLGWTSEPHVLPWNESWALLTMWLGP